VTIPPRVAAEVERALGARIVRQQPLGGGCIHHGTRIDTDSGATLFLKWNHDVPAGMFEAEAEGLRALRAVSGVRAPEPIAMGGTWLVLEHVQTAPPFRDTGARLGCMLAALHDAGATSFGWPTDNWIGSLPQANAAAPTWAEFWRDRRLRPQLERARARGHLHDAAFDSVLDALPSALADVTEPNLLHGDLWSGNWLVSDGGEPVLIDPAVYFGHGEVDLAMSELFGGFERSFYDAYADARGVSPEYRAYRRDLYQLYYLLVHVNLFGASYEAGARAAAQRVMSELAG